MANVGIKGRLAGQALAAEGALKTEGGSRRIEGLLLTLGENRISGDLMLDEALVPEGMLKLSLPDIGPLASLAPDPGDGDVTGTVRFSRVDGVPQIAVDAKAASIVRGDVSVRDAQVTALIGNYLLAPAIIGKVKALSVTSGTTSIANVDLSLTRDGAWTGFSGGATVNDIAALATGRLNLAGDTTTIELSEGSAKGQGL